MKNHSENQIIEGNNLIIPRKILTTIILLIFAQSKESTSQLKKIHHYDLENSQSDEQKIIHFPELQNSRIFPEFFLNSRFFPEYFQNYPEFLKNNNEHYKLLGIYYKIIINIYYNQPN